MPIPDDVAGPQTEPKLIIEDHYPLQNAYIRSCLELSESEEKYVRHEATEDQVKQAPHFGGLGPCRSRKVLGRLGRQKGKIMQANRTKYRRYNPDQYLRTSERAAKKDREWLSSLPDAPFVSADAAGIWGMTSDSARYRLGLLRAAGLLEFRLLRNALSGRVDGGLWRKTNEAR